MEARIDSKLPATHQAVASMAWESQRAMSQALAIAVLVKWIEGARNHIESLSLIARIDPSIGDLLNDREVIWGPTFEEDHSEAMQQLMSVQREYIERAGRLQR